MDKQLHVFENYTTDSVIAYDAADAVKVWEECMAEKYDEDWYNGDFEQVPDDKLYTLIEEHTAFPEPIPDGAELVSSSQYAHTYKATCRAWADARGRCFLGSTEY